MANTHLLLSAAGHIFTAQYINIPIRNAEMVVPIIANVRMAPRLRKKYFCEWNNQIAQMVKTTSMPVYIPVSASSRHRKWWAAKWCWKRSPDRKWPLDRSRFRPNRRLGRETCTRTSCLGWSFRWAASDCRGTERAIRKMGYNWSALWITVNHNESGGRVLLYVEPASGSTGKWRIAVLVPAYRMMAPTISPENNTKYCICLSSF